MRNLLLDTQSTCVIILFNISTYFIYGYYYKVYLGSMKGIYIIYVVLHVMTSAQWSWLLSGMKWCNNLWKSLLCYPRLRFPGEGPCQRHYSLIGGATTIWCHYYVCGLTPDGYGPTSFMAISWRSMAAPIGPWTTGLSGWIPALSLFI